MLDIDSMNSRTNKAFKTQLKIGIDILCVQETTWNSTSILTIAGVKIVYIILCLQHKTVLQVFYREWERLMFDKMFCFLRLHWNFYEVFRESLWNSIISDFNPFLAKIPILYSLETSENHFW